MTFHILIVEDDTSMRENIALFLERAGYYVSLAPNGETALGFLKESLQNGMSYDVVVTDIVMGHVDGIQVMNAAKSLPFEYQPEVILLTGQATLETALIGLRSQAFDYILKPCRIITLMERIAAAVEYRRHRQNKDEQAKVGLQFTEFASKISLSSDQSLSLPSSPHSGLLKEEPSALTQLPLLRTNALPLRFLTQEEQSTFLADRFLTIGLLKIDTHRYEVWFDGQQIEVTPSEYAILVYLGSRSGRACTFVEITRATHGSPLDRRDAQQLLGTHIRNLRKKVDRRYIVSVRSVGYMLVSPNES